MTDPIFSHPRLVAIYDAFDGDRRDLQAYVKIAREFGSQTVLDIGCGTGCLAAMLRAEDLRVIGVEPAEASIAFARAKPETLGVTFVCGTASDLPSMSVDLAVMTGNVAQAITEQNDWHAGLSGVHAVLNKSGRLVFETRVPAQRAWENWNRASSLCTIEIPGMGQVTGWVEVRQVSLPLVSIRWTYEFSSDGTILTSDSTLRFREADEVVEDLKLTGFKVDELRDAPDRPGAEFVFVASVRQ